LGPHLGISMQSISGALKNPRLKRELKKHSWLGSKEKTKNPRHMSVCCHSHFRLIVKLISCVESFLNEVCPSDGPIHGSKQEWGSVITEATELSCLMLSIILGSQSNISRIWIMNKPHCLSSNGISKKFFHYHMLLKSSCNHMHIETSWFGLGSLIWSLYEYVLIVWN
jgi:hypothetical protein